MIERHPYKPESRVPAILLDLIAAIIVGVGIGVLIALGL
jgi:F0F1-type ATP synthase assembly protein I